MLEGYLVYNNSVEKQNPKNHALLERSSQYVKNTNGHWVIGVVNPITQLTYLSKLTLPLKLEHIYLTCLPCYIN